MEEKQKVETKEDSMVALYKVINGTVYRVRVHFDENSKEDMKDKVKKLLTNEAASTVS